MLASLVLIVIIGCFQNGQELLCYRMFRAIQGQFSVALPLPEERNVAVTRENGAKIRPALFEAVAMFR